jgi:hypothetical protein
MKQRGALKYQPLQVQGSYRTRRRIKASICSKNQRILLSNVNDYCTVLKKQKRSEVVPDGNNRLENQMQFNFILSHIDHSLFSIFD